MRNTARQTRENRTITVDFRSEATYFQLLGDGKAFLECVLAFVMSLGFQLKHKATCRGGGCLTRHSHYARVRLGGLTIWRIQCTTCKAVFTVLPHFVLRYRQMRPEVARDALLATHGGLSLELCAVIYHISPMALYRLVCAFGHHSLVTVLTRCGLPLPVYFLADEKHSRCLTDKVYLPTIVRGRVLWHLGYTEEASAAAFTQSYQVFQRAAVPAGAIVSGPRGPHRWLRQHHQEHADAVSWGTPRQLPPPRDQQAPEETGGDRVPGPQGLALAVPHPAATGRASGRACGCLRWASGYATLPTTSPPRLGRPMASGYGAGFRTRKRAGMRCLTDPQMPATSTLLDQAHNAIERKLFAMKGFHHPRWQSTGVSHGAGTPVQPGPLSASSPACRAVWRGSGRRASTHTRLVPQSPNPHLRRLSMSGDTPYH